MVTVEVDVDSVESRLAARQIACPLCPGVLRPWGWAVRRRVRGLDGVLRPRRARCAACGTTQVLLPVTVLLRRAYAAALVIAAVLGRAEGRGHRRVAAGLGIPASTVRGWLRRMAGRLESVRALFAWVAVTVGIDQPGACGAGSPWADVLAALGAATAAFRDRFGGSGRFVTVTADRVAVACSGGRLLAPGWPGVGAAGFATRVASAAFGG